MKKNNQKFYIILFGPPGSGKGTQVEMLAKKLNLPVIATGDLFRNEIKKKTRLGLRIKRIIEAGQLVGDDITNKLVKKYLHKYSPGVIFDGYPRNIKQNQNLLKLIDEVSGEKLLLALIINVSDKEVIKRVSQRRMCACGASYHLVYKKPKKSGICDKCGHKIFIRPDDRPETVKKRLKLYHQQINPVINYWRQKNKLTTVNGEKSIKIIHKKIISILKRKGI